MGNDTVSFLEGGGGGGGGGGRGGGLGRGGTEGRTSDFHEMGTRLSTGAHVVAVGDGQPHVRRTLPK